MITCSKARELMDRYIDGDISERDMTAFEDHISSCDDCRENYELTSQLVSALRESAVQPPADFTARVMGRVRQQEAVRAARSKKRTGFQSFRGWKAYGSACAAVLLLAVIGKTAVYDQYFRVTQLPPADTAYIDDAPNVPDAPAAVQPAEPENTAPAPEQPSDGAVQSQAQPEQPSAAGRFAERKEDPAGYVPEADTQQPSLAGTADGQMQVPDVQMPAAPSAQGQADSAQQPPAAPANSGISTAEAEKEAQTAAHGYPEAEEHAAGVESADQAALFSSPAVEGLEDTAGGAVVPKLQAEPPAVGSSGSGGGGGNGSSTAAAANAIQVPRVCYVTISKSGEGNMLAVQRQVSANVDGSIETTGSGMTVTVDPADFEETLEQIQETGFVESVEITEGSGEQSVFYIE